MVGFVRAFQKSKNNIAVHTHPLVYVTAELDDNEIVVYAWLTLEAPHESRFASAPVVVVDTNNFNYALINHLQGVEKCYWPF